MANQKMPFDHERLDEAIEQLSQVQDRELLPALPSSRLIDDLRRAHDTDQADVQSLARVYMRLQAHKHRVRAAAQASGSIPLPTSPPSQQGWRSMNAPLDNPAAVSEGRSNTFPRSCLTTGAEVLVIVGLLISTLWIFTALHSQNAATPQEGAGQQSIQTGRLLCSVSYGKNSELGLSNPVLDWSASGVIAEAHPFLKTFSAHRCASDSVKWQVSSGQPTWSPDGKRLLLVTGDTAHVLDATTGRALATFQIKYPQGFGLTAWTSDGAQIVSVVENIRSHTTIAVQVQVRNASTGALVRTAMTFAGVLISSGPWVSPNGTYLAVQQPDHRIEFWNIATGQLVSTISSRVAGYAAWVAWSPDAASVAIALYNPSWPARPSEVQIWSTATGQRTASFEDSDTFEGVIGAVAWSPDGKYLAESSSVIHIWDVKAGQLVATFGKVVTTTTSSDGKAKTFSWIAALAWAPDSRRLASITGSMTPAPDAAPDQQEDTLNIWQLS